jgi:RNA polymerase sigma factor (TIGR02999 family)
VAAEKSPNTLTRLLLDWRAGDDDALQRLMPLVYDRMRLLANGYMRGERPDHTLQTTALVHEAYSKLVDMEVAWNNRVHFFAIAARTMRRILVDHARSRGRVRRGGGWQRKTLDSAAIISPAPDADLVALDDALKRLEQQDERKARAVELFYFGGMRYDEIAAALEISEATVHRDLKMARAWLHRELAGD